jgi:uncharacterized coiled-coil protein SlyX
MSSLEELQNRIAMLDLQIAHQEEEVASLQHTLRTLRGERLQLQLTIGRIEATREVA